MDEREEPISLEQILKELQAKGVPLTGAAIAEAELRAAWETTAQVIPFVQPQDGGADPAAAGNRAA